MLIRLLHPSFHPFQGRPSFGLYDDPEVSKAEFPCFHPFQGRPSFGLKKVTHVINYEMVSIPFREDLHSDYFVEFHYFHLHGFPSLSGKTFIRTKIDMVLQNIGRRGFHPFQGRPSFGPTIMGP